MTSTFMHSLYLVLIPFILASSSDTPSVTKSEQERRAIAEIENLGGSITFEDKGNQVSCHVSLVGKNLKDKTMTNLLPFSNINTLNLFNANLNASELIGVFKRNNNVLQVIRLSNIKEASNQFLEAICGLRNLKELTLVDCAISDVHLITLNKMHSLQELNLPKNNITNAGLANIHDLKGLLALNISYSQITKEGIEKLPDNFKLLQILELRGIPVTDQWLSNLSALKYLHHLDLGQTAITDESVRYIKNLQNLDTLALFKTDVSDRFLLELGKGNKKLQRLFLGETRITGTGLQSVGQFADLRVLGLQSTMISSPDLAHLSHLHRLEEIALDDTAVTDSGLVYLESLPALKQVAVAGTLVTEKGSERFLEAWKKRRVEEKENSGERKSGAPGVSGLGRTWEKGTSECHELSAQTPLPEHFGARDGLRAIWW